jgi:hypothetical protein
MVYSRSVLKTIKKVNIMNDLIFLISIITSLAGIVLAIMLMIAIKYKR